MTKEQLSAFMDQVGIENQKWVRLQKLASINFDSSDIYFINNTDSYYFDLDLNIIKVKEYFYLKDVGKTYILKQISTRDADIYFDVDNIASFTIGSPRIQKPDPLISYLRKTELGL
jgi:hypothetical protein